jgi:hypothetical protein
MGFLSKYLIFNIIILKNKLKVEDYIYKVIYS